MATDKDIPADINELPDPATFVAPVEATPRLRKRHTLAEEGGVTPTSLMDILTIILVFLLKSYSTDPVQLKQAEDLKPPFSSAELRPAESTTLTVTLNHLMVDDKPVMKIEQGVVSEAERSGGGYLIDPLFQALQEAVDHQKRVASFNKSAQFTGVVTIISDRHVPFRLLSQVMYTAGQAEFAKFKFMVVKASRA